MRLVTREKKDQRGIGKGSYTYSRVGGVEGPGWRRQRFGERNSVYVVTRDSFTKYTRHFATRDLRHPLSQPPHHTGCVPVIPDQKGVRAHGAPGQGVSTYKIWPGPGSPGGVDSRKQARPRPKTRNAALCGRDDRNQLVLCTT